MTYSDSDSPLSSPPESADEAPPVPRHVTVKPAATTKRQKATAAATAATATKNKKKRAPPAPAPPPTTTITKIKLKAPAPSPSPPPKRRRKEPPHVYTLADSPELAFIVMFRSRFSDAFKGVPNLGCQDIERGIVDSTPSEQVEQLLCRLVGLVLNRKKPVEYVSPPQYQYFPMVTREFTERPLTCCWGATDVAIITVHSKRPSTRIRRIGRDNGRAAIPCLEENPSATSIPLDGYASADPLIPGVTELMRFAARPLEGPHQLGTHLFGTDPWHHQ